MVVLVVLVVVDVIETVESWWPVWLIGSMRIGVLSGIGVGRGLGGDIGVGWGLSLCCFFLNRCRRRSFSSFSFASRCCLGDVGFVSVVVGGGSSGGVGARGGGVGGVVVSGFVAVGGCICSLRFVNLPLRIRRSLRICLARFWRGVVVGGDVDGDDVGGGIGDVVGGVGVGVIVGGVAFSDIVV